MINPAIVKPFIESLGMTFKVVENRAIAGVTDITDWTNTDVLRSGAWLGGECQIAKCRFQLDRLVARWEAGDRTIRQRISDTSDRFAQHLAHRAELERRMK